MEEARPVVINRMVRIAPHPLATQRNRITAVQVFTETLEIWPFLSFDGISLKVDLRNAGLVEGDAVRRLPLYGALTDFKIGSAPRMTSATSSDSSCTVSSQTRRPADETSRKGRPEEAGGPPPCGDIRQCIKDLPLFRRLARQLLPLETDLAARGEDALVNRRPGCSGAHPNRLAPEIEARILEIRRGSTSGPFASVGT